MVPESIFLHISRYILRYTPNVYRFIDAALIGNFFSWSLHFLKRNFCNTLNISTGTIGLKINRFFFYFPYMVVINPLAPRCTIQSRLAKISIIKYEKITEKNSNKCLVYESVDVGSLLRHISQKVTEKECLNIHNSKSIFKHMNLWND